MPDNEQRSDTGSVAQQEVARARDVVLSGHGPGASQEEVLSQTRGKIVQAGLPAVLRLAHTARDTARARSAATFIDGGLVNDLQQPPREHLLGTSPRSKGATTRADDASSPRDPRRSEAVAIATLVLLALLLCRRSRKSPEIRIIRSEPQRSRFSACNHPRSDGGSRP